MKRTVLLVVAAMAASGALSRASAQKAPPASTRPATPGTAAPSGPKVLRPAQPLAPAADTGQAAPPVTPQAVQPSAPAAAPHSAGLAMPPYSGTTPEAALAYAGRFVRLLDSTIVTLVATFRNTSGQPVIGARSPETLSQRERDRWTRCRDVYWDLTTYASAAANLRQILPATSSVQLRAAQLDSAFGQSTATAECDNIASMIAAPDRFSPWQASYQSAARHFYRDFYPQVRNVHLAARALVFALNTASQGHQLWMPPALPEHAPYAGAALN